MAFKLNPTSQAYHRRKRFNFQDYDPSFISKDLPDPGDKLNNGTHKFLNENSQPSAAAIRKKEYKRLYVTMPKKNSKDYKIVYNKCKNGENEEEGQSDYSSRMATGQTTESDTSNIQKHYSAIGNNKNSSNSHKRVQS